jgi:hypothetical protein
MQNYSLYVLAFRFLDREISDYGYENK